MGQVSRPLLALLVGTVAFFAVWLVALRPGTSSTSPNGIGPGLGAYQSAINAAHQAVGISNRAAVAAGGTVPAAAANNTAARTAAPAVTQVHAPAVTQVHAPAVTQVHAPAVTQVHAPAITQVHAPAITQVHTRAITHVRTAPAPARTSTPAGRLDVVTRALRARHVLAILFYNSAAPDDRAVEQELASVPTDSGRVVKLAIPIDEVARYTVVTNQVPISASPTLVLIDRRRQATTIVGFADRYEIAQRVLNALAVS